MNNHLVSGWGLRSEPPNYNRRQVQRVRHRDMARKRVMESCNASVQVGRPVPQAEIERSTGAARFAIYMPRGAVHFFADCAPSI